MLSINKDSDMNKGFTLIEVLVAVAVIAIGFFAMMSVVFVVTKSNTNSKDITAATNLAQQKMETILSLNYGSITTSNAAIGTFTTFTDDRDTHSLQVTVTTGTVAPFLNTKTISVDAYWSPATSTSSHSINLLAIKGL